MPKIDTEKLEAFAQMIFERENQFNTFTLNTIARRVKATGQLSAFDQQSLKNIADITGDMDKITKELARITKMNVADIEKIYTQVINDGVSSYKPLYDFKGMEFKPILENEHAMKLVRLWAELTAETMINLSHTKALGFVDDAGNFTQLAGAFQKTIDDAVIAISTGTTDFNSAMRGTIEQLGGSGVQVWYGSGVHRSLEAMIRQNLLWGAKQAAQSYDDYVSEELGLDGFEVDAHIGCRPSHEFMQGEIYSYNGVKVIAGVRYEDGARALEALGDYGCLHFKTGVLLGVSEPTYSKEELNQIHKETTETIEYNGKEKTLYEWKQTQRRFEREYRKTKTQSDMFKASGNNIAAKEYIYKANAIKSTYDEMTEKIPGLYDRSERMRTYFKDTTSLTNSGSSGIIRSNKVVEVPNLQYIGKIDTEIYRKVVNTKIITDEVIITNNQIKHIIDRRGQAFFDEYSKFFSEIVSKPDFIFKDKAENTVIATKTFVDKNNVSVNLVVRLAVEGDNEDYKNSIITAIRENDKRFKQRLRNNQPIYRRVDNNE